MATGLTDQVAELGAKEIQILREVVPRTQRVAILWNESNPGARATFEQTRNAAVQAGLGVATVAIRKPEDLAGAVAQAAGGRPDVLIVIHDVLTVSHRAQIAPLALHHKLPSICASTPFVDVGGWSRTLPPCRASSSGRPSSWIASSAEQSPPTFRSSSRPRSCSGSTSRRQRLST